MAVANKYQGKPIVFIAVNSGNGISDVASYLNKNGVTWPAIVDSARLFERAAGLPEISLNNIVGYRVLNAEGSLVSSAGLDQSAKLALSTAEWNVDPEGIPDSLIDCWQAIEFGDFVSEARTLQRALNSKKTETQTAAETLNTYVQEKLTAALETATAAQTAGDEWAAYKAFEEFQYRFKGHETEIDIKAELKALAASEAVETQKKALRQYESALKTLRRSGMKRVAKRFKKLIETYPDTEAAQKAQEALDSVGVE